MTLIGLGPGDPLLLTRAAWEALHQADTIYTPVPDHPALAAFREHVCILKSLEDFAQVREAARIHGAACCAVSGDPHDLPGGLHAYTANLAVPSQDGQETAPIEVQIIPGISLLAAFRNALTSWQATHDTAGRMNSLQIITALELDAWAAEHQRLQEQPEQMAERTPRPWCETQELQPYTYPARSYVLQPTCPALLWHFVSAPAAQQLDRVQAILATHYPPQHKVCLVQLDGQGKPETLTAISIAELARQQPPNEDTAIYLPALPITEDRRSLNGLHYVATRLLGPDGCPWDVQQSHQALRGNLLEEVYEVLDALDRGDMAELAEELGDLLFQAVVHSEMARQAGEFDLGTVLAHITSKLIRRHPHVFADLAVHDADKLLSNWEQIKAQELHEKGRPRSSSLDGIPTTLPALAAAQKIGSKAARAGFDWPTLEKIWAKLHEELEELTQAYQQQVQDGSDKNQAHLAEELGDLLYAVAQLARWLKVDAESVLREGNAKFRRRFNHVEQAAQAQGRRIHDLTLAEKVALWQAAKG